MPRYLLRSLALLLVLLPLSAAGVEFRKEFQALETLYQEGELDGLSSQLYKTVAKNDEERALQTYLSAMLKLGRDETLILLQQAIDRYPSTHYGQLSMLEMAKLNLLERQIPQAETLLKKIKSADIPERHYWLAQCAQYKDDHSATIAHGENYLKAAPAGKLAEDTHYLIASAYRSQNKFYSGIATLEKLRVLPGQPKNKQYFHYLLGQLHQQNGNAAEALLNFKSGFELNRRSQLAFEIEDRLYELKRQHGSAIDLSFLYPYTALDLPELVQLPDTTELPPLAEADQNAPVRLDSKPSGLVVQAGRFGSEANAGKLTSQIRGLNLKASYFEDKANKTVPWVVVSGPYSSQSEADSARRILQSIAIDCFTTRY